MKVSMQKTSISITIHILIIVALARGATSFSSTNIRPPRRMRANSKFSQLLLMRTTTAISASRSSSNSHLPPPTATKSNNDVCIRILCLHGKGGNGKQFVDTSLLPLRSLLETRVANLELECNVSFQWDELTAPYEISPPGDGNDGGYSWWTMPPGVRSYNAEEYGGFETSADMVMEKVFPPEQNTLNKTDIILGHSQGAILTSALLSIHDKFWKSSNSTPKGYILNGAAWPNPYRKSLSSLSTQQQCSETVDDSSLVLPRMLFMMGGKDNINPTESALQVHDAFQAANFDVSIVNHAGGHSVPVARRALEEVVDWIVDIAKEKVTSC